MRTSVINRVWHLKVSISFLGELMRLRSSWKDEHVSYEQSVTSWCLKLLLTRLLSIILVGPIGKKSHSVSSCLETFANFFNVWSCLEQCPVGNRIWLYTWYLFWYPTQPKSILKILKCWVLLDISGRPGVSGIPRHDWVFNTTAFLGSGWRLHSRMPSINICGMHFNPIFICS